MQRRSWTNTQLESSALGFGCVSLTMHDDRKRAVALLEQAFDLGITHFDVARLYGFGQAESILGEFLRGKRDRVTVATKFGLGPPAGLARQRRLVSAVRWLSHRVPLVARAVRRLRKGSMDRGRFGVAEAAASLDTSLRELGTEYLDVFLLHEATLEDAARDDLRAFLDDEVRRGRVRTYGVASSFDKIGTDASRFPATCRVLQFDSSSVAPNVARLTGADDRVVINFGCVRGARELAAIAATDRALRDRHADAIGDDVSSVDVVSGWMLRSALAANPRGVVLFATTNPAHLEVGARATERAVDPARLLAFDRFAAEASRLRVPLPT
ncbi:MAG: aldo/keto reductase [Polyangiales bacterium]